MKSYQRLFRGIPHISGLFLVVGKTLESGFLLLR
jgi:hypothetical protein